MKNKLEPYFPNIEKGLISFIFLFVLFNYLISSAGNIFFTLIVVLEVALIFLYFMQLRVKQYALLWALFLLGIASIYISIPNPFLNFALSVAGFIVFGIIILIKTLQMSFKTKNFELLSFIMGFLLVFQIALPLFAKENEVITFYSFAVSFSIGTIVYNDNLWHRYNQDEKNVMKYILIIFLVAVLQSSMKYLNI